MVKHKAAAKDHTDLAYVIDKEKAQLEEMRLWKDLTCFIPITMPRKH